MAFAAVFQDIPDIRCLSAQTYGDILIEAADNIGQKGVKFNTLLRRIAELAVRGSLDEAMARERLSPAAIRCLGEAKVAWEKPQHAKCYVLRAEGGQGFLDQIGIRSLPVCMENAGVDTKSYSVAVVLACFGCLNSLAQSGGA